METGEVREYVPAEEKVSVASLAGRLAAIAATARAWLQVAELALEKVEDILDLISGVKKGGDRNDLE